MRTNFYYNMEQHRLVYWDYNGSYIIVNRENNNRINYDILLNMGDGKEHVYLCVVYAGQCYALRVLHNWGFFEDMIDVIISNNSVLKVRRPIELLRNGYRMELIDVNGVSLATPIYWNIQQKRFEY